MNDTFLERAKTFPDNPADFPLLLPELANGGSVTNRVTHSSFSSYMSEETVQGTVKNVTLQKIEQ